MKSEFSILYVEDDIGISQLLSSVLEDKFENVYVAYNGQEGLELFSQYSPDIILTDIHMPILDGLEMIKKIKGVNKNIPIIVSSAYSDTKYLIESLKLKIDNYLIKPIDLDDLDTLIDKLILNLELEKKYQQMQESISKQNLFVNMILDNQPTMITIFNKDLDTTFVNKTLLDFFSTKSLEEFKNEYGSILETFIKNDIYFHKEKVDAKHNWITYLETIDETKRIVSILSKQDMQIKAFKISIAKFEDQYILTFTDISETFLKQIQLEDKTMRDKLTKAFTREYFDQNYKRLIKEFTFNQSKLALVVLDIDFFKKVNDNYGHDVGDEILIEFVKVVKKYSRDTDFLFRWGGEEFILVLKINTSSDLENSLENLRQNIEKYEFPSVKKVTCSMGATIYKDNEEINNTIKRADEALYKSKNSGRNKSTIS